MSAVVSGAPWVAKERRGAVVHLDVSTAAHSSLQQLIVGRCLPSPSMARLPAGHGDGGAWLAGLHGWSGAGCLGRTPPKKGAENLRS